MLELTAIQKTFGQFTVLDIKKWLLPPGIHWLKGENGSGKSTLLRIMAGQLPFRGEIVLDGKIPIRKKPVEYRQYVNHAEAEPAFPSFLSGDELLAFTESIVQSDREQLKYIREKLGIGAYTANPSGSYSSGMLKKLSLLLAFTGQPRWILLDEPLTTLDQASQQTLCELIMQFHRHKAISFIITSHHDIEHEGIHFDKAFTIKDKQVLELSI